MAEITGTNGDDVLTGTGGNDVIDGHVGDDIIDGGGGDDTIIVSGGNSVVHGGTGDDEIRLLDLNGTAYDGYVWSNKVDAGDGNDVVQYLRYSLSNVDMDLGAGTDLLTFSGFLSWTTVRVTTGAGSDRIVMDYGAGQALASFNPAAIVVTDFTAGDGGDVLDIGSALVRVLDTRPHAANPFADGHLQLIQDGADVIVRIDIDGFGGRSGGFYTRDLFRLLNVDVAQLTSFNFAGLAPNGSALAHDVFNGTAQNEWLHANAGGSTLIGLDGNDRLIGNLGTDQLFGGAGADQLDGGLGNDQLDGGDGNDHLEGGLGDDVVLGGAGDDFIDDAGGGDTIDAGAGNDTIDILRVAGQGDVGTVTINAGDGNDFVRYRYDDFRNRDVVKLVIDLGAGDDRFEASAYAPTLLTLGAGQDRVVVSGVSARLDSLVITDFTAGNSGDILDLNLVLRIGSANNNPEPFAAGLFRLVQSGADTLVVFDEDGAGGSSYWQLLARLSNVDATTLTAFNLGGYNPLGTGSAVALTPATSADDHIRGSLGSDVIDGGAGNDLIEDLYGGSDTLTGGDGDDRIILSHVAYAGTTEVSSIFGGAGRDLIDVSLGPAGHLNVNLGADDDRLIVRSFPDGGADITLGSGSDIVELTFPYVSAGYKPFTILDFTTGVGGDRLDWDAVAESESLNGSPGYNPFIEGDARLVQVGANVQLQIDLFSPSKIAVGTPASGSLFQTLLTFNNTNVADFTSANLGYDVLLPTATGSSFAETINGSASKDFIRGGAGDDQINGLDGDDILDGGDNNDTLYGGAGNDILRGGNHSDQLYGGDGDDNLDGGMDGDWVDGGNGNDVIVDRAGKDTIFGGAGDDTITVKVLTSSQPGGGSISAGDGNDVVRFTNEGFKLNGGYSINLGAGDDVITLDNPGGLLTLGAGRDTVHWETTLSDSRFSNQLLIMDFATGDSGDVLDFSAILRNAGNGSINPAAEGNSNPFASGFVELREDNGTVGLYFYANGVPDAQSSQKPIVLFSGTNLADFTAANFGGYDPHAGPVIDPNDTVVIRIRGDYTLEAGERAIGIDLPSDNRFISSLFVFDQSMPALFTNHGEIVSRSTIPGYSATGIYAPPGSVPGTILNAADGSILVRVEAPTPEGLNPFQENHGIYVPSTNGLPVRNDGVITVDAAAGTTWGVRTINSSFVNTGSLKVSGAYDAYGFETQGASFNNSGSITVHAGEFAAAVYLTDVRQSLFENSGTITAITDPNSPYFSVGVYLYETLMGFGAGDVYVHTNSGTITADIAFFIDNDGSTSFFGRDLLRNSGTINGAIVLSFGDDVLENTGIINGSALLGPGDDQYIGLGATNSGNVQGGTGNDTLTGGGHEDFLFGDQGRDVISGGGGADFIDGGFGADILDGGAGFDTLSFDESLTGVTVNLASGYASDGINVDMIRGFEQVLGSRFADLVQGSKNTDSLLGGGGNDVIAGGAGNDFIRGERGNDDLTGGSGNDTFEYSIGDGADLIRDFASGDLIAIYGYTAASSVQQNGANVLVTLSGGDQITLLNANAALVSAALRFADNPLPTASPPANQTLLVAESEFLIPVGVTVTLSDPAELDYRHVTYSGQGILLASTGVAPAFFNAGTFNYSDSGLPQVVGIDGNSTVSGNFNFRFVNLATGSFSIENQAGDVIGVAGMPMMFNLGSIHVASVGGDAYGFTDLSIDPNSRFVNAGSITIEATGHAVGLGQLYGSSASQNQTFNSGQLNVHGGLESTGFDWLPTAGSAPRLVNTGNVIVSDETAAKDSAAIRVEWTGFVQLWNTGTLQGDYSIKRGETFSGGTGTLAMYNSGSLIGDVDLMAITESGNRNVTLISTGTIQGNVGLANSDDLFDSRQGVFTGTVQGNDGNDRLLTGAGTQTLLGGFGNDLLSGGAGNDFLTGGGGADVFRFGVGFGADIITDFNAAAGDRIEVAGYSSWQSNVQQGADVVVTFGTGDQLVFKNQLVANISASLFTFNASAIASNFIAPTPAAPQAPSPLPINQTSTADDDVILGTAADDIIQGGNGNDIITGAGGNDELFGDAGIDVLTGGIGVDSMTGGAGIDTFRDTAAGFNGDVINDLVFGEKIVITDANFSTFTYNLTGNLLTFTGGSLVLNNLRPGTIVPAAASGGGVELSLVPHDWTNDINGDRRSDLVLRDSVSGWLTDWLGTASGALANNGANASIQFPADWHVGGTGDFNGDRRDDLLLRNDSGWLTNWLGTANGGLTNNGANTSIFFTTDWKLSGLGDFNGDGRSDFLIRRDDGWLTNWLGTGTGSFTNNGANTSLYFTPDWKIVSTGDFDGDGYTDILLRRDDGWVTNWLGTSTGGFTNNGANTALYFTTDWKVIGTADVNGDGKEDLILRRDDGWITDWLGTDSGGFTNNGANTALYLAPDWKISSIGDFNGDGRDDILLRNDSGWMTDWLGNATGSFDNNGANFSTFVAPNWQVQDPFM